MEVAGLTDLLKQEGSYTLFAPTDSAFDDLSKEDFALLRGEHSTEMNSFPLPFMCLPLNKKKRGGLLFSS